MAGIDGATRDLLTALAEALDIPLPSTQRADERAYHELLERRTSLMRASLMALLENPADPDLAFDAAFLRKHVDKAPVTYTPYESAEGDTGSAEPTEVAEPAEPAEDSETAAQRVTVTPAPALVVAEPATVAACQADYASVSGTAARDAMARQAAARARHS